MFKNVKGYAKFLLIEGQGWAEYVSKAHVTHCIANADNGNGLMLVQMFVVGDTEEGYTFEGAQAQEALNWYTWDPSL